MKDPTVETKLSRILLFDIFVFTRRYGLLRKSSSSSCGGLWPRLFCPSGRRTSSSIGSMSRCRVLLITHWQLAGQASVKLLLPSWHGLPLECTVHCVQCTVHRPLCTVHSARWTVQSARWTVQSARWTVQSAQQNIVFYFSLPHNVIGFGSG